MHTRAGGAAGKKREKCTDERAQMGFSLQVASCKLESELESELELELELNLG